MVWSNPGKEPIWDSTIQRTDGDATVDKASPVGDRGSVAPLPEPALVALYEAFADDGVIILM